MVEGHSRQKGWRFQRPSIFGEYIMFQVKKLRWHVADLRNQGGAVISGLIVQLETPGNL